MTSELPRLERRPLAPAGSLAGDLLGGAGSARGLLPDPEPPEGAGARLPAEAFRTNGPEAGERLREVVEGDGVVVTTGQQPLLFLGPMYILYKALTAVVRAERIREEGTPAVALFWVAGDDHDWAEVGRTRLLDLENRLHEVRIDPPPERRGRAVGPTGVDGDIVDRLGKVFDLLPNSDFHADYLEWFQEAYRPGRTLTEAFGRALARVLDDLPLVWLDSAAPAVRRAAAPLFRRVTEAPGEVEMAFREATRSVREAGYEAPIQEEAGGLPLFVDRPEGRTRLMRHDGKGLRLGRDGEAVSREAILGELEAHPERFSPNVALRPVLASWLLPTESTVLGPGELAYWTQLPGLFRWAGVPFPRLRPRGSWTVVEAKVGKVLDKLGAAPGAFEDGGAEMTRRVRERGRPPAVQSALDDARRAVQEALADVEAAVEDDLPGLRSAVGAARHGAFESLDGLQDAVDRRVEEQNDVLLRQIRKAAAHLWPDGRPQERVLSPLYYLTRYGPAFVEHVAEKTRDGEERPTGTSI